MGWVTIEHNGKQHRFAAARTRDGVWIGWSGRSVFVATDRGHRAGATDEATHDEIRAPMTGKVIKIHVSAGDPVEAGTVLVVLEAMKMEYRLAAPAPGTIEAVHCAEGELVDLGKTLVTLFEPSESPAPAPA
jgi:3-methylcrotonyl-CoA carboxylase alpha subunit